MTRHTKLGVEEEFFRRLRAGSRVKQQIVTKYFVAYNNVMARPHRPKVGYADLFAGPGLYRSPDGTTDKSIPMMVSEAAIETELFRQRVHLWFNEGDSAKYQELRVAIESLPGFATLRYRPVIENKIVDLNWVAKLGKLRVPTLVFLDPCGYKGLSLKLVNSVLSGFGNDCIFFFNYSRINMKLDLEIMNTSIDEFFEPDRARALRVDIRDQSSEDREKFILDAVKSSIKQVGAIPLVFRFVSENGRTSHHLVYASKDRRAAGMMKSILKSASSEISDGVGSSEHDPRAAQKPLSFFDGLYAVEERLLANYGGQEILLGKLLELEGHTQFTQGNYRDAVLSLEQAGRAVVDPPAEKRRVQAGGQKRTLPKQASIRFLSK